MSNVVEDQVTTPAIADIDFSSHSLAVLRQLQSAFIDMLSFVPGGVCKSRDLQKLLGIDVKLSWQIFRFIGPGDVLGQSTHIPTAKSLRRLCDAALIAGADEARVKSLQEAYGTYESLIQRHCEDRTSFESMLSALDDGQNDVQADLNHRKAISIGHRHYWGAQIQNYIVSQFVHPAVGERSTYDFAHLRSRFGLRRLRANADMLVDSYKLIAHNGGKDTSSREHFSEEAWQRHGAPILPEFCTRPLPELQTFRDADGTTRTRLLGDAIGRSSAADVVFGHISRNTPMTVLPDGRRQIGMGVRVTLPTTLLIVNAFLHRDSLTDIQPFLSVYGHAGDRDQVQMRDNAIRLPFREKITCLGRGINAARCREVPQYRDLLEYACRRMGWNPDDFDVYSLRLEYPLLDTMLDLQFDLPPIAAPAGSDPMFGDFI